jgi:hypothetical protein
MFASGHKLRFVKMRVLPEVGFREFYDVGVALRKVPTLTELLDKIDPHDLGANENGFGVGSGNDQTLLRKEPGGSRLCQILLAAASSGSVKVSTAPCAT